MLMKISSWMVSLMESFLIDYDESLKKKGGNAAHKNDPRA